MRCRRASLCLWVLSVAIGQLAPWGVAGALAAETSQASARIEVGDLAVELRDNSASPGVLSGIQSLVNRRSAPGFDAFDPDTAGASAGLNFEHIISGHRSPNNRFTPRRGRFSLQRIDAHGVRLVRQPTDSPWQVGSTITYWVRPPHFIDFQFRCTAERAELFGSRGYAIFFFANYMNDVQDVSLHFLGVEDPQGEEQWIAADAPPGNPDWNGGGTYRHRSAPALQYDKDQRFRLNSWSYDQPRYTRPFYYGRSAQGMMLLLMFDRDYSPQDEIRFSLFKFKLPKHPRPAWDFQYVVHKVEPGRFYGFRGRLVWKEFVSPDECLVLYQKWKAELAAGLP